MKESFTPLLRCSTRLFPPPPSLPFLCGPVGIVSFLVWLDFVVDNLLCNFKFRVSDLDCNATMLVGILGEHCNAIRRF